MNVTLPAAARAIIKVATAGRTTPSPCHRKVEATRVAVPTQPRTMAARLTGLRPPCIPTTLVTLMSVTGSIHDSSHTVPG